MGEAGHAKAQAYSWQAVAKQVIEVYQEARAAAIAPARSYEVIDVHDAV
jgi:hypothetical protein